MMRVDAIVLAAGESRRMGRPKPLLPWDGRTLIEHLVSELSASQVANTYVVTGHHAEAVVEVLADTTAQCVLNSDYRVGMLSSVRAGIRAVGDDTDAVLICLGDQPHLPPALVDGLIEATREQSAMIAVPTTKGRRGHPLLFSLRYRDEILKGYEETGLRGLLDAHAAEIHHWDTDDAGILIDLDTPEDYARACESG